MWRWFVSDNKNIQLSLVNSPWKKNQSVSTSSNTFSVQSKWKDKFKLLRHAEVQNIRKGA